MYMLANPALGRIRQESTELRVVWATQNIGILKQTDESTKQGKTIKILVNHL